MDVAKDNVRADIAGEIRDAEGDAIRNEVTEVLEEDLGRPPTTEEVENAVTSRVNERAQEVFDERFPDIDEDDLPDEIADALEAAIAQELRFDLAPEEMIVWQNAGALIVDGKEIIVRHNSDGSETPYYRDHPDAILEDNLLSRPHYTPPYSPPE